MTINQALTSANINTRAQRITEEYRLLWNRHEQAFYVAHKTDRARRYKVTANTCCCPSVTHYGQCKHFLGLPALIEVEIARYKLLGFAEDLARVEAFQAELENAAQWNDAAHIEQMAELYA
jgi:hypothetical protein